MMRVPVRDASAAWASAVAASAPFFKPPNRSVYLKPSGAIGFYHPDWVIVQSSEDGEVHWIVETKGRVWEGTTAKDDAIQEWCERISEATGARWRYMRVNQTDFESLRPSTLSDLAEWSMQ
jgi:hypothetical protein